MFNTKSSLFQVAPVKVLVFVGVRLQKILHGCLLNSMFQNQKKLFLRLFWGLFQPKKALISNLT